jgi:hypothetical protein
MAYFMSCRSTLFSLRCREEGGYERGERRGGEKGEGGGALSVVCGV